MKSILAPCDNRNIAKSDRLLDQLAEIGRVLEYPKIRRKLGWDDQRIELFIKQLYIRSEVIELGPMSIEVPRDPDDAPILATLVTAKADVLS